MQNSKCECSNCHRDLGLDTTDAKMHVGAVCECGHCGTPHTVVSEDPLALEVKEGLCPACHHEVSLKKSDGTTYPMELGYVILCDNCGAELEIVKTDPLMFELLQEGK